MGALFEEIDYAVTSIGALSLRRRRELSLGVDVYEIKLGDDFLMTSLITDSEIALARSGLAACESSAPEVVVGGLGLGYTAQEVLAHDDVEALLVVEFLSPVIGWHEDGVLPMGTALVDDSRCRLVEGDFFAMAVDASGFDAHRPGRRFDAVLVDIDHTPDQLLDDRSDSFYRPAGLAALRRHLKPGGIFGLWSNAPEDRRFLDRLAQVFPQAWAEPVRVSHPVTGNSLIQTVYLARNNRGGNA